jgi:hypothetical protein
VDTVILIVAIILVLGAAGAALERGESGAFVAFSLLFWIVIVPVLVVGCGVHFFGGGWN